MTLPELQTKREEILKTIGVIRATYGDRTVEYSKQADALAVVDAEIAKLQSPQSRQFTVQTSRGLE